MPSRFTTAVSGVLLYKSTCVARPKKINPRSLQQRRYRPARMTKRAKKRWVP